MIVQACVLVTRIAHSMARSSCSRKQRRRRTAVQVVNNVVTGGAEFTRRASARDQAAAFQHDDLVDMRMTVEQRRDPVFHQNVNLNARKKALEGHD